MNDSIFSLDTTSSQASFLNNCAQTDRNNNGTHVHTTLTSSSIMFIVQEILFAGVCLGGLVGNSLVIYVVIKFSKLQTVTNMYIVNLAVADECFLIGIPFLLITMVQGSWIFGEFMCKTYLILTSINQFTSSILIFILSADRYIAVCHPVASQKWRTPMISKIVSFAAWTCSLILIIPIFSHSKQEENFREGQNESFNSCVIVWSDNHTENTTESQQRATTFIIYSFVFSFAIPLCLTLIFYCLVIQRLKTVGPKNKSKEKKRSHRKVTKLVLTVVTCYVLCWLPYWVTQIAATYTPSDQGPSEAVVYIQLFAFCLSYSNSAINPILYAFLSDNFRKGFMKVFTCASGSDVNATLNLENSVFPRKKKISEKNQQIRATSTCPNNEDECDAGLLVSKVSTSAITLTSRSNINLTLEIKEITPKDLVAKNGLPVVLQPATNV